MSQMVRPQGQRRVRLRDHYQRVLEEIVEDHEVPSAVRPDHIVPANAGWVDVVAHTEWYVGGPGDNRPHLEGQASGTVAARFLCIAHRRRAIGLAAWNCTAQDRGCEGWQAESSTSVIVDFPNSA